MICEFIKKYCEKKEKKKIEKATVKDTSEALFLTNMNDYSEPFKNAINEVGIKEHPGENHNPRIVEYHQACDLRAKSDEISWCSAFVNWCFQQAGLEGTKSAAAISWSKWGNNVREPRIGDIVVFRRVDSSWRGHVGFYVGQDGERILVLGGNQGNEVSFQWYPKKGKSIYFFQFRSIREN